MSIESKDKIHKRIDYWGSVEDVAETQAILWSLPLSGAWTMAIAMLLSHDVIFLLSLFTGWWISVIIIWKFASRKYYTLIKEESKLYYESNGSE